MSGKLVALIEHVFTEEEARVLRHLKPLRSKKASSIARAAGRPLDETRRVLNVLAHDKYVILGLREGDHERFSLLPIVPGMFESALMRPSEDSLGEWHRRFAELYEDLYDTGFVAHNISRSAPFVRYIPVGEVIDAIPAALPSDRLESMLERFDSFAITICQCRVSKKLTGDGCGRMLETCTAFGDIADWLVRNDKAKSATMRDVLDTKRAAESEGLVTWMFNVGTESRYNGSCSCCGCCCGALRSVTQFHTPGLIAPPHFLPAFDRSTCVYCEKCAKACPMKAITVAVDGEPKSLSHRDEYCIGCGLCAVACSKSSIVMREVPDYEKPSGGWPSYAFKNLPSQIANIRRVKKSRQE
jgi:electron transport complex protein RnfB